MQKEEIINHFQSKVPITTDDINCFFDLVEFKSVKKNEHIVRQGDSSLYFILIKSGCLMTYFKDKHDHKHAIQFGQDMWWTGDLDAIFNSHESSYSVKAIMPSEVYLLSKENFEQLIQKCPVFEKYFRILYQNALISHQKRIIRNISYTAEEKYLEFVKIHPRLELIVPQKYIASYMGITPEFLSKLKRKLAQS
ncbi:Crp/Fnr family transcriptional regulator [Marivirga arenosa]|uniref:Crp/Fnr family transcriptional regulator n=1 Tax=Marivirga arenosa TaxID=3059076 RepID=A0AA49GHR8_9BACT|nr:Crp/Fnr family transcriptional regulator [Marivirga sp. ABR2-2]WKK83727.1 Crp/Fnr family transcriptional regulator [Marivirga sp. ABR2-2]